MKMSLAELGFLDRNWSSPSTVDKTARGVVLLSVASIAVTELIGRIGLFADGSYIFYYILQTHGTFIQEQTRAGVDTLTQFPLVSALRLGITNISYLSDLWNASLVLIPTLLWTLSLFILRRHPAFWFVAILFAFVAGSAGLFAIGEYNTAYALFACGVAVLITGVHSKVHATLLVAIALASVASYPSSLYLGVVSAFLTWAVLYRKWKLERKVDFNVVALSVAAAAFISSSVVGLVGILHPQGAKIAGAENYSQPFRNDQGQFTLSLIFISLFMVAWLLRRNWAYVALGLGLLPAILFTRSNPITFDYSAREVVGFALLVAVLVVVAALTYQRLDILPTLMIVCATAFVLWTTSIIATDSIGYNNYLNHFRSSESTGTGVIIDINGNVNVSKASQIYDPRFAWSWGESFLSVDLVPYGRHYLVLNPGLSGTTGLTKGLLSSQLPLPWRYHYRN
jgi:hypothetical protein